jgi:hypothetical protein
MVGQRRNGPQASRALYAVSILDAALELASSGVPVFPCGPDKAPRVTGGFHSASTDEATINGWSWDGAMIGRPVTPGTIVVDIDPRNGGHETREHAQERGPRAHHHPPRQDARRWPPSLLHRPRGLELRKELGPGIDVQRAGKAYVIAPPSEGYEVKVDIDPAPAPDVAPR